MRISLALMLFLAYAMTALFEIGGSGKDGGKGEGGKGDGGKGKGGKAPSPPFLPGRMGERPAARAERHRRKRGACELASRR